MSPTGVDVGSHAVSLDGKQLLMIAGAEGQQNLYVYSLDDLSRDEPVARQLTSTSGGKSYAQWSPDGKEVFYLEQGRIQVVPVESRTTRTVAVSAEMDVRFDDAKRAVFRQAGRCLSDNCDDETYHGAAWDRARATYGPYVAGARTRDEMRRVISLMIGDLNASHTGIF